MKMSITPVVTFVLVLVASQCLAQTEVDPWRYVTMPEKLVKICTPSNTDLFLQNEFDLEQKSPFDLLDLLQNGESHYTPNSIYYNWVKASDVDRLIDLLDSKLQCAHVVSPFSSHLPNGYSTVGNEAAYMLEGYIFERYPTQLTSTPRFTKGELRLWHQQWKPGQSEDVKK